MREIFYVNCGDTTVVAGTEEDVANLRAMLQKEYSEKMEASSSELEDDTYEAIFHEKERAVNKLSMALEPLYPVKIKYYFNDGEPFVRVSDDVLYADIKIKDMKIKDINMEVLYTIQDLLN